MKIYVSPDGVTCTEADAKATQTLNLHKNLCPFMFYIFLTSVFL